MTAILLLAFAVAEVESGPKAGEKVAALKVYATNGDHEGKDVDIAAERKKEPTIYLFVNSDKFSRPMARFLRELDGKIGDASDKAAVIAVWVGGDADKNKEHLPRVQMSIKLAKTTYGVFTGAAGGPEGWAINADAHLTAVVVHEGKVAKSFPFVSVNDTDVKGVLEEFTKALKKK